MASLKDALTYAAQNPTSDFAKQLTVHIQSGKADAEAQQNGIDLTPIKRAPAPTITPVTTPETPAEKPGIIHRIGVGIMNAGKGIFNALTSSEQAFGNDIAAAIGGNAFAEQAKQAQQKLADSDLSYLKKVQENRASALASGDTAAVSRYDNVLNNFHTSQGDSITDLFPALKKTNVQVAGDAAGVLLDTLLAGTYGSAAKGAKTGELLVKTAAEKAAETAAAQSAKAAFKAAPLGQKLAKIGTETAVSALKGAGVGYAYDVAGNAQEGKTGADIAKPGFGTLLGGGIPLVIGGVRATAAVTKDMAPRIINSLVKPKTADFSYGKDPGRTVSEMGITGNNLEDFGHNISVAKNDVGKKLGDIYSSEANAGIKIDATDEIKKIDDAIAEAAKGGKNNQAIVTQLSNIKDSLLYDHAIDGNGNIIKASAVPEATQKIVQNHIDEVAQEVAGNPGAKLTDILEQAKKNISLSLSHDNLATVASEVDNIDTSKIKDISKFADEVNSAINSHNVPVDLSNLNPVEAFNFKKEIAARTRFTGNPSDDKTVNSVLKNIYGSLKEKLNTALKPNNPEILDLNQKFADLTSAEIATKNRDAIVRRSNLVSLPVKTGAVTAALLGGFNPGAILGGVAAGTLEKALASTAVKTRVAAWLGSQKPSAVAKIIENNPGVKEVLIRVWPKLASQIKL